MKERDWSMPWNVRLVQAATDEEWLAKVFGAARSVSFLTSCTGAAQLIGHARNNM